MLYQQSLSIPFSKSLVDIKTQHFNILCFLLEPAYSIDIPDIKISECTADDLKNAILNNVQYLIIDELYDIRSMYSIFEMDFPKTLAEQITILEKQQERDNKFICSALYYLLEAVNPREEKETLPAECSKDDVISAIYENAQYLPLSELHAVRGICDILRIEVPDILSNKILAAERCYDCLGHTSYCGDTSTAAISDLLIIMDL